MLARAEDLSSGAANTSIRIPLIAHVVHSLKVGGLENGLVNLINRIPVERFHHAVVCITDYSDFSKRIDQPHIEIFALHKPPGNDLGTHLKLWRLFRRIKPDIVHTRNLSGLEAQLPALLAGVPVRIHSEHGRDIDDLAGDNLKHLLLRRAMRPFADRFVGLSHELERYLREKVRVPSQKIVQIYNGVDTEKFFPRRVTRPNVLPDGFAADGSFVIGTVGRMQPVKNQLALCRAFVELIQTYPDAARACRLVIIGEGPLREPATEILRSGGCLELAWLAGERSSVPEIMRSFDLFVLPSLNEGISNTILEAMASGLPVVATRVGGNPELVQDGLTGTLVTSGDRAGMVQAMHTYYSDRDLARRHGLEARRVAEQRFRIDVMVAQYLQLYETMLGGQRDPRAAHST